MGRVLGLPLSHAYLDSVRTAPNARLHSHSQVHVFQDQCRVGKAP